jgi:hypothetical protein
MSEAKILSGEAFTNGSHDPRKSDQLGVVPFQFPCPRLPANRPTFKDPAFADKQCCTQSKSEAKIHSREAFTNGSDDLRNTDQLGMVPAQFPPCLFVTSCESRIADKQCGMAVPDGRKG